MRIQTQNQSINQSTFVVDSATDLRRSLLSEGAGALPTMIVLVQVGPGPRVTALVKVANFSRCADVKMTKRASCPPRFAAFFRLLLLLSLLSIHTLLPQRQPNTCRVDCPVSSKHAVKPFIYLPLRWPALSGTKLRNSQFRLIAKMVRGH